MGTRLMHNMHDMPHAFQVFEMVASRGACGDSTCGRTRDDKSLSRARESESWCSRAGELFATSSRILKLQYLVGECRVSDGTVLVL